MMPHGLAEQRARRFAVSGIEHQRAEIVERAEIGRPAPDAVRDSRAWPLRTDPARATGRRVQSAPRCASGSRSSTRSSWQAHAASTRSWSCRSRPSSLFVARIMCRMPDHKASRIGSKRRIRTKFTMTDDVPARSSGVNRRLRHGDISQTATRAIILGDPVPWFGAPLIGDGAFNLSGRRRPLDRAELPRLAGQSAVCGDELAATAARRAPVQRRPHRVLRRAHRAAARPGAYTALEHAGDLVSRRL